MKREPQSRGLPTPLGAQRRVLLCAEHNLLGHKPLHGNAATMLLQKSGKITRIHIVERDTQLDPNSSWRIAGARINGSTAIFQSSRSLTIYIVSASLYLFFHFFLSLSSKKSPVSDLQSLKNKKVAINHFSIIHLTGEKVKCTIPRYRRDSHRRESVRRRGDN